MTYSTWYRGDRMGCVNLTLDTPDDRYQFKSTFQYTPVFWWNLINIGDSQTEGFYLQYDISGTFFKLGAAWDSDYGKIIIADANFADYFVLFTCRKEAERILDFATNEVHIYTRTGDPNFVPLDAITKELKAQMPTYYPKWELLQTRNCTQLDFWI